MSVGPWSWVGRRGWGSGANRGDGIAVGAGLDARELGRGCGLSGRLRRRGGGLRGEARKEKARRRSNRLGPWRVQLRFAIELTLEQYVAQEAWLTATLEHCPGHPEGGCGFSGQGTYHRKLPIGCEVARWYCPTGRVTYSLLPDCLAARMTGTLERAQQAAVAVAGDMPLQQVADRLRPPSEDPDAVGLSSAVEWMKRRHRDVLAGLIVIAGLMPEMFGDCPVSVDGFAKRLGTDAVLVALRHVAADHLQRVPAPIGFLSRPAPAGSGISTTQQSMRTIR